MRRLMFVVALVGITTLPGSALAQPKPKLQVSGVRIGYPGGFLQDVGEKTYLFKAGAWAPVQIDIQAGRDGLKGTEGRIDVVVETPDADDVGTNYTVNVPLDKLGPNEQFTVSTFAKVSSLTGQLTVTLYHDGQPLTQPAKVEKGAVDSGQAIYLTLGSRLPGLRRAMRPDPEDLNREKQLFDPRESPAYADAVHLMPQHWFGYDGVDLVILATGNRDFLKKLEAADPRYLKALAEWVMRGGHLIVSVGQNQDAIAAIPELQNLLPVNVTKKDTLTGLRMDWRVANAALPPALPERATIDVCTLEPKPGRPVSSLLNQIEERGLNKGRDLIVQGSAGLGRVTVVAFDLDQRPFTDWKGQSDFWHHLVHNSWPRASLVRTQEDGNNNVRMNWNMNSGDNQVLSQMYSYLENFEEVPVISFGWVALFIFLYILVVGPLDYFFLKKVVKRLELTWITFPTVVLTISAVAYFTAYYIKGKDLRIRKVDLVDVDMTGSQPLMAGRTWFTLFSPRIQHYTVGVEPAPGEWVPTTDASGQVTNPNVVVSWLGRPESDRGNMRSRGQSFFRRAYDYEPAASGLRGVPIQVWSTKSFTAAWQSAGDPAKPLLSADLRHVPGDDRFISGKITWLPGIDAANKGDMELKDAYLIYNNQAVKLALAPGKSVTVNTKGEVKQREISVWFRDTAPPPQQQNYYPNNQRNANPITLEHPMKSALFFDEFHRAAGNEQNNGLRMLDQSWRLRRKGEAILVGRLASKQDAAEVVTQDMISATKLWLGALPGSGATRPRVEGILRQDTYVRLFVPVQN